METKALNMLFFLITMLLVVFISIGNKIFYFPNILLGDNYYKTESFDIEVPIGWYIYQETNKYVHFIGFPTNNKFVTLDLYLWKFSTVFAENYDNCKNGYAVSNDNNSEILVCIEDKNISMRPYFTYFFRKNGLYSVSTKNYKPYFHQEYMQMLEKIKHK